ncbi:MAG: hypothetical protein ACFFDP_00190 [Promethearchaeota archaeon]
MSTDSPLKDWKFLIGKWKGKSEDQFDEEGKIETSAIFSLELNGICIAGKFEAWNKGQLINSSISLMFFDSIAKIFRRKTMFSYGFVNNEVEYKRNNGEIRFDVTTEPIPKQFMGIRWRSYIRKISESEIAMGLEKAEEGEDFAIYGETVYRKEHK